MHVKSCVLFLLILLYASLLLKHQVENATACRLGEIEDYLAQISPGLSQNCASWAEEHRYPTWLCGPTSFAVATDLNARFFQNELPVVASRTARECIQLKIGAALMPAGQGKTTPYDHVWIQIYWRGLILMVDPTYSQFDHLDRVVFAWFDDNESGRAEFARFKSLLRLHELDRPTLARLGDPDRLTLEVARTTDLLNHGGAPADWHRWAALLYRNPVPIPGKLEPAWNKL